MSDVISVVPWGLHPLQKWVIDELRRRSKEYGENPNPSEGQQYSGPRTAWVRFFSNGVSLHPDAKNMDGFVMGGVNGFSNSYGFDGNKIAIGVDAKGNPHKISYDTSVGFGPNNRQVTRPDFPHRPPPSVESVSCELNGGTSGFPNTCRKITINWKCNSLAQLNYLIPYFLTPRITCLVEWGWNNYDNISLVDLTDLDWINNMFVDPSYTTNWIKASNGNYDAGIGFITDYGYKMNDAGGYECFTTITNANRLIEGEQIHNKEVTQKQGDVRKPVKSFKEFVKNNLKSIDSDKPEYVNTRKLLNFTGDIRDQVFRISKSTSSKNKSEEMWIRMDLVKNIMNAFFRAEMQTPKTAPIRELDIDDVRIVASPFLKSSNENVLIPNQFAPRFAFDEEGNPSAATKDSFPEFNQYNALFREGMEKIKKEYPQMKPKFDNLKDIINKNGNSFPVYKNESIYDTEKNLSQNLESGYWGYLKDLFINVKYFSAIVENNDSVLKMMENLLQGINEAMCQICQLKLVPPQYGNSKYSIIDENMSGISDPNEASNLPKITLGSLSSAFIRSVDFNVKISSEMMNQLVFQSANPNQDPEGSIQSKNVAANPITSRYSGGDRLYRKGEIKTVIGSDVVSAVDAKKQEEDKQAAAKAAAEEAERELKKKQKLRNETNSDTFLIYYDKENKSYLLCEKNNSFMNYILKLPNKKATYLNNGIMPSTTMTIELLGISGIDYLSQFTIDHAPEAYSYENAVWQIADIRQNVEDKMWTTTIVAQVRPLTII